MLIFGIIGTTEWLMPTLTPKIDPHASPEYRSTKQRGAREYEALQSSRRGASILSQPYSLNPNPNPNDVGSFPRWRPSTSGL